MSLPQHTEGWSPHGMSLATAAAERKGAFWSVATSLLAVPGVFKPVADKLPWMSLALVIKGWNSAA